MSDSILKPMLAVDCGGIDNVKYPVWVTPKLDGIRCLTLPPVEEGKKCRAVSRTFKSIPNDFIREWIEQYLPPNLDGELVVRAEDGGILPYNDCQSWITRKNGEPNFVFMVFDAMFHGKDQPYTERMAVLSRLRLPRGRVQKILPIEATNSDELSLLEGAMVEKGYEGVMLRSPESPYKFGRSTRGQGYLLKLKRFVDAEAEITGVIESTSNRNELGTDELGYAKRSYSKCGMVKTGMVGALKCRDLETGVDFGMIYNHMTLGVRPTIAEGEGLIGKIVKFKYQPSGAKEAPRFPQPIGWREAYDMGQPE